MDLKATLPPANEALSDEDIVLLEIKSTEGSISYRVKEDRRTVGGRLEQAALDGMAWEETAYYALIKGLLTALEMGSVKAIVRTRYPPITERMKAGSTPSGEMLHLHMTAVQLIEQFDEIDLNPKPWEK